MTEPCSIPDCDGGCPSIGCDSPGPDQAIDRRDSQVRLARRVGFTRGARAAAAIAQDYDSSSTHDYRLGDCILGKLNLRGAPPRRNRARVERPTDAFLRGFAVALSGICGLLIGGGRSSDVCRVARDAGVCLADLRDAGVAKIDLRRLREAGVPVRRRRS